MRTCFSFVPSSSLRPVWHVESPPHFEREEEEEEEDLYLTPDSTAEEEGEDAVMRSDGRGLSWRPHRPIFDAAILCAKYGREGVRVRFRSDRMLELEIYDAPLFYACVQGRQTQSLLSRIKSFRRYFVPIDGASWTEATERLKPNSKTAYLAYRDAVQRYDF